VTLTILIPLASIFGLLVGSFLNVVIHRIPRGGSIVTPRSRCPYCDHQISAWENIPVISFLALRRRCRACKAPISWRYPAVEALTGGLFGIAAASIGPTLSLVPALIFISLLIVLALIDYDHMLLPDKLTLSGILIGLACQPLIERTSIADALLGTLIGAGSLILLINFWYWLREEEGMGLGDVNMLAMIGAFYGWQGALVALVAAAVSGSLIAISLLLSGRAEFGSRLPFGVFLAVGGLVVLFAGEELVAVYRQLL